MRYFYLLIFFHNTREIEGILISKVLNFKNYFVFAFLMFFSEFFGGIAVCLYQKLHFLNKKKQINDIIGRLSIKTKRMGKMNKSDNIYKIIILIFFSSFFDLNEFIILYILPNIAILSPTSDRRMYIIITITSSLLCIYALKFKIGKHNIFSLIGMSVCSFIILVLDFIYKPKGNNFLNFILAYILVFLELIFVSFVDVTERYLVEYNFINKFIILSAEGFFGIILCVIYSIITKNNVIKDMHKTYEELNKLKKLLMILFLILFFIISAGINIYKIICNVIYTPIAKSLPAFIFNPLFIVYYFILENDFVVEGKKNYFYFIANVILSLIIDFFSLVYNEFLVLNCCGLEQSTYTGISLRADENSKIVIDELSENDVISLRDDYFYLINEEE